MVKSKVILTLTQTFRSAADAAKVLFEASKNCQTEQVNALIEAICLLPVDVQVKLLDEYTTLMDTDGIEPGTCALWFACSMLGNPKPNTRQLWKQLSKVTDP